MVDRKTPEEMKRLTLQACLETAEKYENPKGRLFFLPSDCAYCYLHFYNGPECKGCPMATIDGKPGCYSFDSARRVEKWIEDNSDDEFSYPLSDELTPSEFLARAKFHRDLYEIIKDIPAERFTKEGWEYLPLSYDL